jgi:hypothetical protein
MSDKTPEKLSVHVSFGDMSPEEVTEIMEELRREIEAVGGTLTIRSEPPPLPRCPSCGGRGISHTFRCPLTGTFGGSNQ